MPLKKKHKEQGFTLVELMIAMLLLTFGLLSALTLEVACIQGNSTAARIDEATGVAQAWLEQLRNQEDPADLDPLNGVTTRVDENGIPNPNGLYFRTAGITGGPTPSTRRVEVVVTWATGPGNRTVRLVDLATGRF